MGMWPRVALTIGLCVGTTACHRMGVRPDAGPAGTDAAAGAARSVEADAAVRALGPSPVAVERRLRHQVDLAAFEPGFVPAEDVHLSADGDPPPAPSVLAPPVTVYGERPSVGRTVYLPPPPAFAPPSPVSEETRIGPNRQPEWTTQRRFATSRAYVLPPYQVEFESWWRGTLGDDDTWRHRFLEEIGIGLPHRFQVDLYWRIQHDYGEDTTYRDFQVEARWALAPWGCIPLNPTLYAEWKFVDEGPDVAEAKLLLATELAPRWHWAMNFTAEQEVSGEEERELAVSMAVSHTLLDSRLSLGVEALWQHVTVDGARDDPEIEFLVGPSLQWRPTSRTHLDIVPLFGTTEESPAMQIFVVFGVELFGGRSSPSISAPTSTRSR